MKKNIGVRIKHYRMTKKVSQEQLAELTDLSVSFISKVETNRVSIGLNAIIKIANALEVPIGDLLEQKSVEESEHNISKIAATQEVLNKIVKKLSRCEKTMLHIIEDVIEAMITSINNHRDEQW
ncbi:transcriptional regulator with XRE-family HTH domain [Aequitasia blattaphilus]|uniref:Helix-turn-helix domain-containing protein n=2 Tax=Lachnospiraceae TaxID=186803 RepID=A0ABT1EL39_9FIRM|nr:MULTISPECIES: helix-turn-helix transcriptional regulator [Lachnospiraceae]MCP1101027.1 helix-turn-helix domain-containing protein [Aequitasia blattaphilus]MCP1111388.1 helix-turn-helix domain-containing protein [Ohessyouella blattaphilus]MCR8564782.1 helix-turn-helix domain-containing protein [Ohessyouella blattaphilus]MCR8613667.1 helix-turn-helix domain-containing protein [Aequitasia blattaphilus]